MNYSVKGILESLEDQFDCSFSVYLKFKDITIKVRSNTEELALELDRYFREFIGTGPEFDIEVLAIDGEKPNFDLDFTTKIPDPGKTKIKEEHADIQGGRIVNKVITGMTFIFGGDVNIGIGPAMKNSNQIINFINNRFIGYMLNNGCLLYHSAGIITGGRGFLLSGFSGAGKSTLALHTMGMDLDFLSNDRAMVNRVDSSLMMYGVAKLPRVNPGTLLTTPGTEEVIPEDERKEFLALPKEKLWDLEHKYDLYIDEVFGENRFELSARMDGLVILNWKREDIPFEINKVDLRERPDLMPAFVKSPGLFFLQETEIDYSNEAYIRMLADCPVYEITGGVDFQGAAKELKKILENGE